MFVFFTAGLTANAQFTLTRNGFVNTDNPEQRYIVLEFPEKTQQELFKNANVYFHSLYANPRRGLQVLEDQLITVDAVERDTIFSGKILWHVSRGDLYYTISLEFKDGRVKVNAPTNLKLLVARTEINREKRPREEQSAVVITNYFDSIFDRRGKIKQPKIKQSVENYFHNYILAFYDAINNDW